VGSEAYAAPGRYCHLRIHYRLKIWRSVLSPSPSVAIHSDVHEGSLDGSRVCVKRVRGARDPEKAKKAHFRRYHITAYRSRRGSQTFYQEAVVWKRLEHRNIVPFLGIAPAPLQLISEWIPGGELRGYIKKRPGADRLGLASPPVLVFDHTLTPVTSYLMSLKVFTFSTSAT
jgi:serine/threonine protein kinase